MIHLEQLLFFPLEAWDYIAVRINKYFKKGQRVTVFAHKVIAKGSTNGNPEVIWCVEDITLMEDDPIEIKKTKDLPFEEE